jgi:hypothetical protein
LRPVRLAAQDAAVEYVDTRYARTADGAFEDAGEHELKGVPDHWRLYRVVA